MALETKKFGDIFEEDSSKQSLTLLVDVKVRGEVFRKGTSFTSPTGLGGVDFHKFRYLDVGVEKEEDVYRIEGFIEQKAHGVH